MSGLGDSDNRGPAAAETRKASGQGHLRVYLGAAPGVGKTYSMLKEAHRRKERGADVVIGFVETHGRPRTAEQIGDLEIVPPREISYKGVTLREMDTAAVIARHPAVALVDEMAHTNAPGSKHQKRYEDIEDLLDAGITVISTLNIQHIESLNDIVGQLTGVTVNETVPDWVLDEAEEVELVDMSPEALIQRMKHGNIYAPEQARRALDHFFTLGNLAALRDLALRATAREVEEKLTRYMRDQDGAEPRAPGGHILVAVDHRPIAKALIRQGWRMASALKVELTVVHVEPVRGPRATLTVEQERQLRKNLQLADELGAAVVRLRGKVVDEIIAYSSTHDVAGIVIGHPSHSRWEELLHGSVTAALLRRLPGMDVHVIAERDHAHAKDREEMAWS